VQSITSVEDPYKNLLHYILADKSTNLEVSKRMELLELKKNIDVSPNQLMGKDINARFKHINSVMTKIQKQNQFSSTSLTTTQKIDKVLTNKYLGLPIAFIVLYLVFEAIFSFAEPPMNWIESGFGWLGSIVSVLCLIE